MKNKLMKILFVVPSFKNGGTMTSLKNIVSQLDLSTHIIDVYAITNIGPNREFISQYANVIGLSLDDKKINLSLKVLIKRSFFKLVKSTKKILNIIGIDISAIAFKSVVHKLEKNSYDVVIGFQEGQPTRFVSFFTNSRKVAWVHSDYSNMLHISKQKPQHKLYSGFDKIVCVSEFTKDVFVKLLPDTIYKTIALHNLVSTDFVLKKSEESIKFDNRFKFQGFKIVSLGRIDPVKRFSFIPRLAFNLKEKGYIFKWYILGGGEGDEKQLLINNINLYKVNSEVILLGEKNNPYPYIKGADLLVSTSLSEACPYVINEAKILDIPIVSTDFGSVYEFIEDNVSGLISPIENIADKIELMISNKEVYNKIKDNISQFHFSNDEIMNVLYNEILVN